MQDWKLALVVGGVALGGVAVGAQCFGARPAAAQTGPYARCVGVYQAGMDVGDDGSYGSAGLNRQVLIPTGWEPIGGGGSEHDAYVVLCSRH